LGIRPIWASAALNDYLEFPYVGQVFCIERHTEILSTGKTCHETVYGVTSLDQQKADPIRLLELARRHWTIENRPHWVRDVTFDEDRCCIRKGNGPQVMASLRNLAVSRLRMAGAKRKSTSFALLSRMWQGVLRRLGILF
jgi:hypothetical protein